MQHTKRSTLKRKKTKLTKTKSKKLWQLQELSEKNTLGDNNKMHIRLREYDMSTQNLSYVFRSTMGVGMLVPFMKIVCQKGDIFDIKLANKTMTHPTLGPLFGSFKLQHFIFTAGFRLYNSFLS